jgi:hypothetical protein
LLQFFLTLCVSLAFLPIYIYIYQHRKYISNLRREYRLLIKEQVYPKNNLQFQGGGKRQLSMPIEKTKVPETIKPNKKEVVGGMNTMAGCRTRAWLSLQKRSINW